MKFNLQSCTLTITEEITSNTTGDKKIFIVASYNGRTKKLKLYKEALKNYFNELYLNQTWRLKTSLSNKFDEEILLCYIQGYEFAFTFNEWFKMFYNKEHLLTEITYDFNSSYPSLFYGPQSKRAMKYRKVKGE